MAASQPLLTKQHELDGEAYHLVLLCQNQKGYENLIYLVSQGFLQGFYNKPRVDWDLLKEYQRRADLSVGLSGRTGAPTAGPGQL